MQELETQLQDLRRALLEKRIRCSDQEEEIDALKRQLQELEQSFGKLEEEKRDLDELVIKVSQELRSKEYDMRDFNYQMATEKELAQKQLELLRKELQEEKERKNRLEILESDLIHKADTREQENDELRLKL